MKNISKIITGIALILLSLLTLTANKNMTKEYTFSIIKPDAMERNLTDEINQFFYQKWS